MISGTIIRKNTKTQSAEHSSIATKKEKEIINSLKQNSAKQSLPSYALPVAAVWNQNQANERVSIRNSYIGNENHSKLTEEFYKDYKGNNNSLKQVSRPTSSFMSMTETHQCSMFVSKDILDNKSKPDKGKDIEDSSVKENNDSGRNMASQRKYNNMGDVFSLNVPTAKASPSNELERQNINTDNEIKQDSTAG